MQNKIIIASVLAIIFALAGHSYAVGQNSNNNTGVQTETANQGENTQLKTQTNEQVQNSTTTNKVSSSTEAQIQQRLQDGSGDGAQVQNQGETNQLKNNQATSTSTTTAQQRRSQVANAVQAMLQVADRNSGIGQQVRTIAEIQTQNQEKLETSLQKVQSRSGFAKFLVGPNYGEIKNAQKILEQNKEQIKQLNQVKNQLANQGDAQTLTEQIQTLEQNNLAIENSLNSAKKGFSLLGWAFKLFSK